jgi:hypothetical protein
MIPEQYRDRIVMIRHHINSARRLAANVDFKSAGLDQAAKDVDAEFEVATKAMAGEEA